MKRYAANEVFQPNTDKIVLLVSATPATLSYSADGETWTEWSEEIMDDNNVINNIPLNMYMKVSVDCVITERETKAI